MEHRAMRSRARLLAITALAGQFASAALAVTVQNLVPNPTNAPLFHAVAIDGNLAIAGGQYFNRPDFIFTDEGGAFLFNASTGAYIRSLYPTEVWQNPMYGCAVDLGGGRAIVGAYRDRVGFGPSDYGAAYVYNTSDGSELFKLNSNQQQLGGHFGEAVAINSQFAVVGAPWESDLTGSVYLFNPATGQQIDRLALASPEDRAEFGSSIAIDGARAVIGAVGGFTGSGGGAFLYDLNTRTQVAPLVAPDLAGGSHFGIDVAISGNRIVVGAIEGFGGTGSAYVFDATDGHFIRKLTAADLVAGDAFGISVAIEGNIAMVSSRSGTPVGNAGAVYVFDVNTGAVLDKFQSNVPQLNSDFGWQVDFTGTTAVMGTSQSSAYLAQGFNIPEPACLLGFAGTLLLGRRRA